MSLVVLCDDAQCPGADHGERHIVRSVCESNVEWGLALLCRLHVALYVNVEVRAVSLDNVREQLDRLCKGRLTRDEVAELVDQVASVLGGRGS